MSIFISMNYKMCQCNFLGPQNCCYKRATHHSLPFLHHVIRLHWNAIELCNYCTKVNRVLPPLCSIYGAGVE